MAVSQGTVDNTDPAKLIIPTIQALKDSECVVVATTAGAHTQALRERFPDPNVVIEDFIDYDDLFPHVDVFVTSGGFGSNLAAFLHGVPVVGAGKREGKNDINARVGLQPARYRPAQRTPKASKTQAGSPHPPRGPHLRQQRRRTARRTPRLRPHADDRERDPARVGHHPPVAPLTLPTRVRVREQTRLTMIRLSGRRRKRRCAPGKTSP